MWKRWFPAYRIPKTLDDLVESGVLVDGTHKDDATPHFDVMLSGGYLVLWVDHPTPDARFIPGGPRYGLELHMEDRLPETVFGSDRLDEMLVVVRQLLSKGKGMRLL